MQGWVEILYTGHTVRLHTHPAEYGVCMPDILSGRIHWRMVPLCGCTAHPSVG